MYKLLKRKANDQESEYPKLIVRTISSLLKVNSRKDAQEILNDALQKEKELAEKPRESSDKLYLDFSIWLGSKLDGSERSHFVPATVTTPAYKELG